MDEAAAWLDDLVWTHVRPLFSSFEIGDGELVREGQALVGVLGFSGAEMSGAFGILATPEVLDYTAPPMTSGGKIDLEDWIGELANQALGRLKFGLMRDGIDIYLATPVVLGGLALSIVSTPRIRTYSLHCAGGILHMWLDCLMTDALPPPEHERNQSTEDALDAGELVLF